jgi:hypothetical protein
MIWYNVKDLRALAKIGNALNMHNIAQSHFYDLRYDLLVLFFEPQSVANEMPFRVHSAICGIDSGLFVSFCTVLLKGDDAEMHKVTIPCHHPLLSTHMTLMLVCRCTHSVDRSKYNHTPIE